MRTQTYAAHNILRHVPLPWRFADFARETQTCKDSLFYFYGAACQNFRYRNSVGSAGCDFHSESGNSRSGLTRQELLRALESQEVTLEVLKYLRARISFGFCLV
jgi:hypothetical protein